MLTPKTKIQQAARDRVSGANKCTGGVTTHLKLEEEGITLSHCDLALPSIASCLIATRYPST